MLKKVALLGLLFSIGSGVNVLAATDSTIENVGVSTQNPSDLIERGTSVPQPVWNVKTQGRRTFSGQSAYNDLYTNYLLTGDKWYNVSVTNKKEYANYLSVQAYKSVWGTDKKIGVTQTVQGQTTKNYTLNGLADSDKIYLHFKAPTHFEGWIE